jgi:hypothetical protein
MNMRLFSTLTVNMKHQSLARPTLRPLTLGNWMFHVVADLTSTTKPLVPASNVVASRYTKRISRFVPIAAEAFTGTMGGDGMGSRPSSLLAGGSALSSHRRHRRFRIGAPREQHSVLGRKGMRRRRHSRRRKRWWS